MAVPERSSERLLSRLFRPFGRVEPQEVVGAALMTSTVFLLLLAYYLLKTAREPLILLQGGAEVKSYAAAGQAVLLLFVVRAYSELAKRVGRMKLIASVYLFFGSNWLLFAALTRAGIPIGVAFYLWVGLFNGVAIAQFWSFANDIYSPAQGQRLFGILGIGMSLGAVAGAAIAKPLAALGPATLMLVAACVLVLCVGLLRVIDRRSVHATGTSSAGAAPEARPIGSEGPWTLLLRSKYLLWMSALMIVLNCVNSTGEYLLDRTLLEAVRSGDTQGADATTFIGQFKADFFGWVNAIGTLLQLFVVSRVLQFAGVRRALFVLPVVAAASYCALLFQPVLALLRIAKIAENSLDYSVQNTARHALFLVSSRVEKYVGKATVDTLMVRLGDVASAGLIWVATRLELPIRALAGVNLALIAAWLFIVVAIGREHRRRSGELEARPLIEATA